MTGPGIAILSASGGLAAFIADLCGMAELRLPGLTKGTQAKLHELIPQNQAVGNPVDTGYFADLQGFVKCASIALRDPQVDVLVCTVDPDNQNYARIAPALAELSRTYPHKQLVVTYTFPHLALDAAEFDLLTRAGVLVMPSAARAIRTLQLLFPAGKDHDREISRRGGEKAQGSKTAASPPAKDWSPRGAATTAAEYGIPLPRQRLCRSATEAAAAAKSIGFPVAVKLIADAVLHKTDVGGVHLGARSQREVRNIVSDLRRIGGQGSCYLVQEMAGDGLELLLGGVVDQEFGRVIVLGVGGIGSELEQDVAVRTIELVESDAYAMLEELRVYPILRGFRGQPPLDIDAAAQTVLRFAALFRDAVGWAEADINPLLVRREGCGVLALDIKVVASADRIH